MSSGKNSDLVFELGELVVRGLRSMRSYIERNTVWGRTLAECQLDLWFTEVIALELDCSLPVIPGVFRYFDQRFSPFLDLYFDKETSKFVTRFLSSFTEQANDIIHVLDSALLALGFQIRSSSEKDNIRSFFYWVVLASQDRWVQVMKYHKDWLFVHYADLVHREYPEAPSFPINKPGSLYFGSQDRFLKRRLRDGNLVVLNTILQGIKKGMLPVSDSVVIAAAQKHAKILGTPPPPMPERFRSAIQRTAREVFGLIGREDVKIEDNEAMSSHSCVESVRSKGGFNGKWRRETYGLKYCDIVFGHMIHFKYSTDFLGFGTRRGEIVTELRCPSDRVADSAIERAMESFLIEQATPVRVKFILEPLKVRTISCGSYESYACQKPLQKTLWKRMQKFSCFMLTGTSIDCGIMQKIVAGYWEEDDILVSGDYTSATDLLNIEATLCAMEACMTGPVMRIALSALGPQLLEYYGPNWICKLGLEDKLDQLPTPVWQRNGQLMGSFLSFPFLCLINAAVYREAYETWHRVKISIRDLPVLVNGDDIGFRSSWEFYDYWRFCITQVGFKPSVGKNFTSKTFININSQYYRVDSVSGIHYVAERVPYVNMGIITGRKKGDTLDDLGFDDTSCKIITMLSSAQANVRELLEGHDLHMETIYNQWKEWNSELESQFPVGYYASGFGTQIGPSTCSEARLGYHLSKVRSGKLPEPDWMGGSSNTTMGAFWKPFVQFHDEVDVLHSISRAVYRWKRSANFKSKEPSPTPETLKNEILIGGSSWSVLPSRAVITEQMKGLAKLDSVKVTDYEYPTTI